MNDFYTISHSITSEQTINKSRFIGIAIPLSTLEEVNRAMVKIKKEYPNARHYVYAYRLYDQFVEKSSDDGEPQGTGGRPLLDILQYKRVWNVLLVVVRYFGGILLGTGGLVRAYGGTGRQVIIEACLKKLIHYKMYCLSVPYEWYEPLKYQFVQHNWSIRDEKFHEIVELFVCVPEQNSENFVEWIENFTRKQVNWKDQGTVII